MNEQLGGGALSDNGFEVRLNRVALDSESANDVPVTVSEETHDLQLVAAAASTFFRGFLIRIEGENVDTTDYLDIPEGDVNIQVVSLCVLIEEVGGVAHTNNNEKTEITALLRLIEPTNNLSMDVTMVVQNRDGKAEWYNSRYILNAVTGEGQATVAPSISPAPFPVPSLSSGPTTTPKPTSNGVTPTVNPISSSLPSSDRDTDTTPPSESPLTDEPTSSGNTPLFAGMAASVVLVLASLWM